MERVDDLTQAAVELTLAGTRLQQRADNLDGLMANVKAAGDALVHAGEHLHNVGSMLRDIMTVTDKAAEAAKQHG